MISLDLKRCADNLSVSDSNSDNISSLLNLLNFYSDDLESFIYLIERCPKFVQLLDKIFHDNRMLIINNEFSNVCSNKRIISIINLYCIYNNIYINYNSKYVKNISVLSKAEEELLFIKYNDPKNRSLILNELVAHNIKLVMSIVSEKQFPENIEVDDLIEEGKSGLIIAIEKFDVSKGCRFSTYATWWIRQVVWKYLNEESKLFSVPCQFNSKIVEYDNYVNKFKQFNGRIPTYDEIKRDLGYDNKKIDLIRQTMYDPIYIDSQIDGDNNHFIDSLIVDSSISIEEDYDKKELHKLLYEIILSLKSVSNRDKKIFIKYYGLDGNYGLTSIQLAEVFKCSTQRIQQINSRILKMIQNSSEYTSQLNEYRYSNKKY